MSKKVTIIGGHGNVAQRLTRLLIPTHHVKSTARTVNHQDTIKKLGAEGILLSLEESTTDEFSAAFEGQDVVYFIAGAGGQGGEQRTKSVDYEGAVKVFDAIENIKSPPRPRLILVSAIDIRDAEKVPAHYVCISEEDIKISDRVRGAIPGFMQWKYEADKNLVKRNAFKWTILRPGGLTHESGTGKASIGRTHINTTISRDDVAKCLMLLLDREDAAGLALDMVGGDTPIEEALDAAIKKGETDFLG
ncbi:NADH(P)-binding-domain-containing protein [Lyophyllum atratum]|nr:NADH(P)-binding-domain-containing protein [Lyophyllum atratum]